MIQNDRNLNDLRGNSTGTLLDYVYLLWRWTWLILLAGVLAGGVVYYLSHHTHPTYQTSMRLFVSIPANSSSLYTSTGLITGYMTTTYSQMVTDYDVLYGVSQYIKTKYINLNITPDQLSRMINVSEITNTQLIIVTVSGPDPNLIIDIANQLFIEFKSHLQALQAGRFSDISMQDLPTQAAAMGTQVAQDRANLSKATDTPQQQALQTQFTEDQQLYNNLLSTLAQVGLVDSQTATSVAVSDPARQAIQVGPKTKENTLLAIALAMLLAAGGVFAIDALDDSIKNPEEIRQKFNLPILGVIASYKAPEGKTIALHEPRSPVTESFRSLRTNITYSSVDRPLRRVVVTSPSPQDGKTTVITNLGVVLAQGGKTVAVVDADLRRPMIHKRFGLPNLLGLSELFVSPLDEIRSFEQTNEVHGLTIVTSGVLPPNPSELVTSHKMIEILDRLNQDNEIILIDTPPILSVTDATALGAVLDGVILVVKPGVTKMAAFKQALEQLRAVGAHILGVVLNEVEPRSRKYGYYYRRYYSKDGYYYAADGQKVKKSRTAPSKGKELKQE